MRVGRKWIGVWPQDILRFLLDVSVFGSKVDQFVTLPTPLTFKISGPSDLRLSHQK